MPGRLGVSPGQGVFDGLFDQPVFRKPFTGPVVEIIDGIPAEMTLELVAQQFLKQMVETKPPFFIIQIDQEQVLFF